MHTHTHTHMHTLPYDGSGDSDMFSHREFSFTLEDDVYVRYQSFANRESLEEGIRKANPYKIDVGAIFSAKVRMSRLSGGAIAVLPDNCSSYRF